MAPKPKPPEERFWAKVEKTETCWLWRGATSNGYGAFWDGTRQVGAHQWAYESVYGPVPEGHEVDHVCRVKRCVRPHRRHLEAVTPKENQRRGTSPSSVNARKTHCPRGHRYDAVYGDRRECKTCNRAAARRRYWDDPERSRGRLRERRRGVRT